MILPTEHIPICDTCIGIGGIILKELTTPRTVAELWSRVRRKSIGAANLERFYLTLDFLYTMKLIAFTKGLLHRRVEA